jgi:hypothetical protein
MDSNLHERIWGAYWLDLLEELLSFDGRIESAVIKFSMRSYTTIAINGGAEKRYVYRGIGGINEIFQMPHMAREIVINIKRRGYVICTYEFVPKDVEPSAVIDLISEDVKKGHIVRPPPEGIL